MPDWSLKTFTYSFSNLFFHFPKKMGRKDKNRQNRRKSSQKHANSKTKATDPSTRNTKEVKMDEKKATKDGHRCSDEIQAAGNFPSIVTEEADGKEGIMVEEQRLINEESDMVTKEIEELLSAVSGSIQMSMESIFFTEYEEGSNLLSERLWDYDNYLKSQHPEVFENMRRYISLKEEQLDIQNYPHTQEKLDEMSRSEAFMALKALEKDAKDSDEMLTSAKMEDDDNEITTDLEEDGKQIEMNDGDDIQRTTHSIQKATIGKEGDKDSNGTTGDIQETEYCPDNMGLEFDDEALMKIIDAFDENTGKAEDCSKYEHTNEMLKLYPRENESKENLLSDLQRDLKKYLTLIRSKSETDIKLLRHYQSKLKALKEMQEMCSLKEEITESCGELEESEASNEKAHQMHDIELKNIESYKKEKDSESSTDYIEKSDQSLQNASKDRKKGKRGKDDNGRPNDDIPDSHSDFKNDFKEFLTLQISKLDEQAKKYKDIELVQISTEEIRDISSEKEHLTNVAKTTSHETGDATNNEDGKNDEVATAAELDDEPDEVVVDLDKNDFIHFEFETNDEKHIFAGNQYYCYSLNENQGILFNYKDESIQVCFTGNQIAITTEDSEFNISIQKANSVVLTDQATQTNTLS